MSGNVRQNHEKTFNNSPNYCRLNYQLKLSGRNVILCVNLPFEMLCMTTWKLFLPKLTGVKISRRQLDLLPFFVDDYGFVEFYLVHTEKSPSLGDFNHASLN